MGSKTLKKGVRTGLTRNQKRKLHYAALSAKQSGGTSGNVVASSIAGRKRKTNHNRGHTHSLKDARRTEAKARQAAYDNLSVEQKIAALDKLFGKGLGAQKERAKLLKPKKFNPFSRDPRITSLTKEDAAILKIENEVELKADERAAALRKLKQMKKERNDKGRQNGHQR